MGKSHSRTLSFAYAISGIKEALIQEPNLRIHFVFALLALLLGAYLKLSILEWIIILFTISFVIILELINTVLEIIIDMNTSQIQPEARMAKDISASCVLISATIATFVGILIYLPKIIQLL